MDKKILIILDYLLPAIAAILLAWEWWRRWRAKQRPWSLIVVTVSCLWFLLWMSSPGAIGPWDSRLRVVVLAGNLLAVLAAALVSATVRSHRSVRVILSALALAWVWFISFSVLLAD